MPRDRLAGAGSFRPAPGRTGTGARWCAGSCATSAGCSCRGRARRGRVRRHRRDASIAFRGQLGARLGSQAGRSDRARDAGACGRGLWPGAFAARAAASARAVGVEGRGGVVLGARRGSHRRASLREPGGSRPLRVGLRRGRPRVDLLRCPEGRRLLAGPRGR